MINVIPWTLYTLETDRYALYRRFLWAPVPVWTGLKTLVPIGIRLVYVYTHAHTHTHIYIYKEVNLRGQYNILGGDTTGSFEEKF